MAALIRDEFEAAGFDERGVLAAIANAYHESAGLQPGIRSGVPGEDSIGLFQLNAAEQDGWAGYMSQNARAWALAEFLRRKEIAPDDALTQLSSRPGKLVRRAVKEVCS